MKENALRLAIAQINCTVGDLEGNVKKIKGYIAESRAYQADIVVFPELAITGYPPEDLLIKPKFIRDNLESLKGLAKSVADIVVVAGFVDKIEGALFNAAALLYKGKIKGVYQKAHLPNYGVFDEQRYFSPGKEPKVFKYGDYIFGVNICEDIWHLQGPVKLQSEKGAKLIINISASPYYMGKVKQRQEIIRKQAKDNRVSIVYANLVGGQDELVFDGQSMVVNSDGRVVARAVAFKEDLLLADIKVAKSKLKQRGIVVIEDKIRENKKKAIVFKSASLLEPEAEVYQALTTGLRDYVVKNGFQRVVIGLSGGIDSALVATLAADALARENVTCVFMPSRYSSFESEEDAKELAQNLGIKIFNIPIEGIYKDYLSLLEPYFTQKAENIAEENLQARIRGNLLMALSNKFGWLVLTTGNKSEMSTGYATLYGDMAGGFAVIKDVPKTLVYKLSKYRNSLKRVIPERVIIKEPTAELKPNQKDSDTLPVYEKLDPILKAYVEEDKDLEWIVRLGFDQETVRRVSEMVDQSEYKRRQSPPGIKITPKAFGRDRRMPITNKYKA